MKTQVTNIHMKLRDDNNMVAICNVEINHMISINDVRVIKKADGTLFVAMPSKRMDDGKFRDMVNPTNRTARNIIAEPVLQKYKEMMALDTTFFRKIS